MKRRRDLRVVAVGLVEHIAIAPVDVEVFRAVSRAERRLVKGCHRSIEGHFANGVVSAIGDVEDLALLVEGDGEGLAEAGRRSNAVGITARMQMIA